MKYKGADQLPNGQVIDEADDNVEEGGEIINDFLITPKDSETGQRHQGRHFQIEYSLLENAYLIKDLGVGQGAFVRLEQPQELKDNHLVNIGNGFIIVNLIYDNERKKINSSSDHLSASTLENSAGRPMDKENGNPNLENSGS